MEDFEGALETFHKCLVLDEAMGKKGRVGADLNNIGMTFYHTGDIPKGLEYYFRALEIFKKLKLWEYTANAVSNIGLSYVEIFQYDKAIDYLKEGAQRQRVVGNTEFAINISAKCGQVMIQVGDVEEGERLLVEAIHKAEAGSVNQSLAPAIIMYAEFLLDQSRVEEASTLLHQHKEILDRYAASRSDHQFLEARILFARGDFDAARKQHEQCLERVHETNLKKDFADVHRWLRDLAAKTSDLQQYIAHNDAFIKWKDEVTGSEPARRVTMLEKEREILEERREHEREHSILYATLPPHVADRLIKGENVSGDTFERVSVILLDIVGFTKMADNIPPSHVVHLHKAIFDVCDDVCEKYDVTRVKTIGDSYFAVAGLPVLQDDHEFRAATAALEMMNDLRDLEVRVDASLGDTSWTHEIDEIQVRIGVHTGPVVAGIVGSHRLQYDVWGDTVNVASRMESTGEPGRIQVSESFARALCLAPRASGVSSATPGMWHQALTQRGEVNIKGKGSMTMYWLEGA